MNRHSHEAGPSKAMAPKPRLGREVRRHLRAILSVMPEGMALDDLDRAYERLTGTRIPWWDLKAVSLEDFVYGLPSDLVRRSKKDGKKWVSQPPEALIPRNSPSKAPPSSRWEDDSLSQYRPEQSPSWPHRSTPVAQMSGRKATTVESDSESSGEVAGSIRHRNKLSGAQLEMMDELRATLEKVKAWSLHTPPTITNLTLPTPVSFPESLSPLTSYAKEIMEDTQIMAYRNAIQLNKKIFRGKIILDVGSRSGVLAVLAAKAGATQVIAIGTEESVQFLRQIVSDNSLAGTITVIQGKLEEIQLPNNIHRVDVVMSEWLGHCLFHDNKLDVLIHFRDRWLRPGGVMFPDRAVLTISAVEDREDKDARINLWGDMCGVDMKSIRRAALSEPLIKTLQPTQLISNPFLLKEFDLTKVKRSDLEFCAPFRLAAKRDGYVHALATYFRTEFGHSHTPSSFGSSPEASCAQWKRTIYFTDDYMAMSKDEWINGVFRIRRCEENQQEFEIEIDTQYRGKLSRMHEINYYKA